MTSAGRQLLNPDALPRIPDVRPSASGPPARASGPSASGPPARASGPSRRLEDHVPGVWAAAGGASWLLLLAIALSIEPRPSDPAAIPSSVDALFVNVLVLALSATAFGFSARRRVGFAASLVSAGVLLAGVLACPATGHHELGTWWYGQLACVSGLIAVSVLGLLRAPTVAD